MAIGQQKILDARAENIRVVKEKVSRVAVNGDLAKVREWIVGGRCELGADD